jgi:antibiotic biosynthesis monooxygenase (ABM) superfamily enzyme
MENAPVIAMTFVNLAPGTDDEIVRRYFKWVDEVYNPMLMKLTGVTGSERYTIIHKNPEYPSYGMVRHFENVVASNNSLQSPERIAVIDDVNSWVQRGVRQGVWTANYGLVAGFRAGTTAMGSKKDTRIENAPIMHLEAYRMSLEEQEKYNKWFNELGGRVFVPLFMKTCGLKGYDYMKFSSPGGSQARETEYPAYLSILYFEDIKTFEHFEESAELVSFQSALCNVFPLGLNYKWYVQYQLLKSWRK